MENSQPLITVEGFSNFSDVSMDDIVPWTPLRAGQSIVFLCHDVLVTTDSCQVHVNGYVLPEHEAVSTYTLCVVYI